MKIKHLLLLVCIAGCFAACNKSESDTSTATAAAQFTTDTIAIRKYIVANNIPALKDKSGVFYQIIAPGTGTVVYSSSTIISGTYSGKLLNGTIFDSGLIQSQYLSSLIEGWRIGIPYIQNGGQIRLIIPSVDGYGTTAVGSIPANSILDFTVTLNDVQ